jgi:hypothetical protein
VADRFYLPVEGLTVHDPWTIGPVQLQAAETVYDTIRGIEARAWHDEGFWKHLETKKIAAFAVVEADDFDEALVLVRDAFDLMTVFAEHRAQGRTTKYGLVGDTHISIIQYAQVGERTGYGWRNLGEARGSQLGGRAAERWDEAVGIRFAAGLLGRTPNNEAERRAGTGVRLLAQAARARDDRVKVLTYAMALEAMLMPHTGPKALQFAQRITYFAASTVCTRDDACPMLALDPRTDEGAEALRHLTRAAETETGRGCSTWQRAKDLYAARSAIVHGESVDLDDDFVDRIEFLVMNRLSEPILRFLAEHPDHPADDLTRAIGAIPVPPDLDTFLEDT